MQKRTLEVAGCEKGGRLCCLSIFADSDPPFGSWNTSAAPANNPGTGVRKIRSGLDDFRRRGKPVAPLWRARGHREAL
jgi:hypothetical protein